MNITLPNTLIALGLTICAFGIFMLRRNNKVFRFRMEKLALAKKLSLEMIDKHDIENYLKPYDVLNTVSYTEMVYKWWIPLEDFYAGTMLDEREKEEKS